MCWLGEGDVEWRKLAWSRSLLSSGRRCGLNWKQRRSGSPLFIPLHITTQHHRDGDTEVHSLAPHILPSCLPSLSPSCRRTSTTSSPTRRHATTTSGANCCPTRSTATPKTTRTSRACCERTTLRKAGHSRNGSLPTQKHRSPRPPSLLPPWAASRDRRRQWGEVEA